MKPTDSHAIVMINVETYKYVGGFKLYILKFLSNIMPFKFFLLDSNFEKFTDYILFLYFPTKF